MHSVGQIVALARDAAMSTSYKPALLKAIVRITRAAPAARIALEDLGAEFLHLYWVQTVVFRLRQAATLKSEPEVVREIRSAASVYKVRDLGALPPEQRAVLARRLARVLRINVLEAFHTSKPEAMEPLFTWGRTAWIALTPDALAFVRDNAPVLEAIANLWWARYLEKVNLLAPLVIEKVERDGAQRGSLGKYLTILRAVDGERCFYCERPFSAERTVHIDHVIPWSFLLSDPVWDLVLACRPCNLSKSDTLPHHDFIVKLAATHVSRAKRVLPPRIASPIIEPAEFDRFYSAALGVEWPAGWVPAANDLS